MCVCACVLPYVLGRSSFRNNNKNILALHAMKYLQLMAPYYTIIHKYKETNLKYNTMDNYFA